jgi:NtrC-family two-component system response regulator AlgB
MFRLVGSSGTRAMQSPSAGEWSALVVDDDAGVRQSLRLCLETGGFRALGVATPSGAIEALTRATFDVVLLDLWLGSTSGLDLIPEIQKRHPRAGIIVITAFATFETAVHAMRVGAADYLPKPFTPEQVRHSARRLVEAASPREAPIRERDASDPWVTFRTTDASYGAFVRRAERVAGADASVLLRGESGSGKNVVAQFLHANSARKTGPFVTVHCPALTGDLAVSLLFGHRKGAFTGAVNDAPGKVQEAEGGTLFLDEVGDLGPDAQARLLRFLNDKSYERVGDTAERRADVRLVTATNRPLETLARNGSFREDLLYRLDVVSLTVPPLRSRKSDILALARQYLAALGEKSGRHFVLSPSAERALGAHDWPGNLRELRNAVERATVFTTGSVLEESDLALPTPACSETDERLRARADVSVGDEISLEALEREHIARVVARSASLEAAARTLQIDSTTLSRKRKRYGLS